MNQGSGRKEHPNDPKSAWDKETERLQKEALDDIKAKQSGGARNKDCPQCGKRFLSAKTRICGHCGYRF